MESFFSGLTGRRSALFLGADEAVLAPIKNISFSPDKTNYAVKSHILQEMTLLTH